MEHADGRPIKLVCERDFLAIRTGALLTLHHAETVKFENRAPRRESRCGAVGK